MSRRALRAATCLALAVACLGCASRKAKFVAAPARDSGQLGVYRVTATDEAGETRRFRIWLWAALPDRLHGEIVTPIGRTEWIVDAGGGRISVARVRDRVAYLGSGDPESLRRLLGLRLTLEHLVAALWTGEVELDVGRLEREPEDVPGLPSRLTIERPEGRLALELKRLRPLGDLPRELGTGEPPAGWETRSIEEWEGLESLDAGAEATRH